MKKDEKPRAMVGKIAVWCAFDELVPVPDLKPHPKNPNQHTEEQIRILAKIIKNSGWRESITVSKLSGYTYIDVFLLCIKLLTNIVSSILLPHLISTARPVFAV